MTRRILAAAIAGVMGATPALAQSDLDPANLTCSGTEPFWNLTLDGETMRYTQMDAPDPVTYHAGPAFQSINRADRWVRYGVTASGELITVAILASAECSDLMSETVYETDVMVIGIGERVLAGCCRTPD